MDEKAKEARRKYQREWSKKNKDKVREYNRRYWEKRAAADERKQEEADA